MSLFIQNALNKVFNKLLEKFFSFKFQSHKILSLRQLSKTLKMFIKGNVCVHDISNNINNQVKKRIEQRRRENEEREREREKGCSEFGNALLNSSVSSNFHYILNNQYKCYTINYTVSYD